jgi:sec-independent protein translocase protein TatC
MLLAFGLVFETPVVVFLLVLMGVVDIPSLSKWRRYVIVIAFVIAAIVTPTPDPFTQTMMAVPMVLLYELGLLVSRMWLKANRESF